MQKDPAVKFFFIWACNGISFLIAAFAILGMKSYDFKTWSNFYVWTVFLCIAHLNILFRFRGIKVSKGYTSSIALAAVIILPFPLFCITSFISMGVLITKRIFKKHPEPVYGIDFNTAGSLISAYMYYLTFDRLAVILGDGLHSSTVIIILSAIVYACSEIILITLQISINKRTPFLKAGTLGISSLITQSILVMCGGILGRVYQLEPLLILLMFFPLIALYNILEKVNKSRLAYVDGKTGLFNYRYFDKMLYKLFTGANCEKSPISLIFGDMDHLRDINNTYGHQVGDKALISAASVFKKIGIRDAIPVRFGGEEFVLVLPGYNKNKAMEIAENIRQNIEKIDMVLDNGESLQLTISLGVSSYPEDAASIDLLIKKADDALYEAKRAGRNQVRVFA